MGAVDHPPNGELRGDLPRPAAELLELERVGQEFRQRGGEQVGPGRGDDQPVVPMTHEDLDPGRGRARIGSPAARASSTT